MRHRVVKISEVMAHPNRSLSPSDYLGGEDMPKDPLPPIFRPDGEEVRRDVVGLLREASIEAGKALDEIPALETDAAYAHVASVRNAIDTVRDYMETRTEHRDRVGGE